MFRCKGNSTSRISTWCGLCRRRPLFWYTWSSFVFFHRCRTGLLTPEDVWRTQCVNQDWAGVNASRCIIVTWLATQKDSVSAHLCPPSQKMHLKVNDLSFVFVLFNVLYLTFLWTMYYVRPARSQYFFPGGGGITNKWPFHTTFLSIVHWLGKANVGKSAVLVAYSIIITKEVIDRCCDSMI